MSNVVLIALTAEKIPAALRTTVRADRRSTVSTFSHGRLAAWHPNVAVTGYVFDL